MDELVKLVENWAKDKGLDKSDPFRQMSKVVEELGETNAALARNNQDALRDGIGDVVVTLIILAMQCDMDLYECLNQAYNEIKDRTGETQNGIFVKSEDLNNESSEEVGNIEYNRKVKIPRFVAEYIERCNRSACGLIWAIRPDRDANENTEQVYDWLFPNGVRLIDGSFPEPFEPDNLVVPDKENQLIFARAWLDSYEVEEEVSD